ncbi:MAG: Hpt domain-containing protein [Proteobacteria bacterium]|nr:Hpt domain-containing protein [Pseudomonadota bacterium]
MSSLDAATATGADGARYEQDLGPLAWVLDELRKSLDGVAKGMRRFVRDAEIARQSDLAALDAAALRVARQQLHQAGGALAMVGMDAPAQLLRAMETAVQRFVHRPELCSDAAAASIERASFALIEYLECVLAGKQISPVALFPQYREVQALAGVDRVHPADLWSVPALAQAPTAPSGVAPLPYGAEARARLDGAVLRIVKNADAAAAADMQGICQGFAAAQPERQVRSFWTVCAGFFEALARQAIHPDLYAKRVASRVLMQYATLAKGDNAIGERLLQDLLFFCAQATPPAGTALPALQAVRASYGLQRHQPVDYERPRFGLFDPALLAQARKRIAAATETWSALAGGDRNKLKPAVDQFSLVCDSLHKLHPQSDSLAQALTRALDATQRRGEIPPAALAMEVATAVLYLQASFEELDASQDNMGQRAARLAERLDGVVAGGESQPLEPWMEDLYRRVSDQQTMGSVVGELRATMAEAEKSMDQFFRQPQDLTPLASVPGGLQQMRGVLSLLGLDQAALAVVRMRDLVERLLVGEVAPEERQPVFDKLGNSLGALGFLIDMLSYQRAMARKLFVYDHELGELRSLMGRAPVEPPAPQALEPLAPLAPLAPPAPEPSAAAPVPVDAPAATPAEAHSANDAAPQLPQPVPEPEPQAIPVAPVAAAAPAGEDAADDDTELQDIFLEEAREVVANGLEAVQALRAEPGEPSQQTALRRAFHTLKGSSRMVGLTEFGAAAWAMEQTLNAWLAEEKPMPAPLLQLSQEALQAFGRWADDIQAGAADHWQAQPFAAAATAMREQGRLLPLTPNSESDPEPLAEPAPLCDLELPQSDQAPEPPPAVAVDAARPDRDEAPEQGFPDTCIDLPDFAPPPPPAVAMPEPVLLEELDFAAFEQALQEQAAHEPQAEPQQRLLEPLPQDLADALETQLLAEPSDEILEPQVLEPQGLALDLPGMPLQSEPAPVDVPPALAEQPAPQADAQGADAVAPESLPVADEAVKVIEHLRIGIPLYNVYLNEADEWSRRLATELQEWSLELHQPLPESAVALAHSLAGSSATVGFAALSDLARQLEHALQHVQLLPQGLLDHAQALNAAADDIRRLLHQFAAGFLKEPNALVRERLEAILRTEVSSGPAPLEPMTLEQELAALAGLDLAEGAAPSLAEPAPEAAAAQEPDQTATLAHERAIDEAIARAVAAVDDIDDDIDALDVIDPDLFPIFEEEAAELLPAMGSALRQWAARPENLSARNELLRALHTLKGSARLAGAMRLGEMAHRMESAVEQIGTDGVTTAAVEPLLAGLDVLQADFEVLRTIGAQPLSEPVVVAAPEAGMAPQTVAAPTLTPAPAPLAAPVAAAPSWQAGAPAQAQRTAATQSVRVRAQLLDRLVNQAGEVMISRSRLDARLGQMRASLADLTGNLERLRQQLRDIEVQAETQMQSRLALSKDSAAGFDPLEFDRFTRVQELTRMMAESVNDVATVQRNLQRSMEGAEDDLIAQGRQARELQRDLLRTRMVEFESIAERLYAVVRQVSKETGKQIKLDISGGSIEMDRGVLDRMAPAFEHLLRNCAGHGIEAPEVRVAAGKTPVGTITIALRHEGNDVSVEFRDDGAGLDMQRIRSRAVAQGLIAADELISDAQAADLIFRPGFTTASEVTGLSGRGIGMDVVRSELNALGGRIETQTAAGQGSSFRMLLPLTTAVTQVVMLRAGKLTLGVPANLVEVVRRSPAAEVDAAYASQWFAEGADQLPFYWAGALLQAAPRSAEVAGRTRPVLILRSAAQRLALHVDEVLGNQEVVVKNLGPQLSRLPGVAGMSVLASGAVVLIYNPVALATVYGEQARAATLAPAAQDAGSVVELAHGGVPAALPMAVQEQVPLILVVDDSITVRRVTQRLLQREGYRVALAADGLQALARLQQERPAVVLSDIEMPRMDGFDLARNIRADAVLAELPIIMITSRIAQKHRDHAAQLGVNHYLGKPYSDEELLSLVRHYARLTAAAQSA